LQPFRDFWSVGDLEAGSDIGKEIARDAHRMTATFLIVTLPDPIDSRFAYRFDALLTAIEMATHSQRWYLDRFWLPWAPTGKQPEGGTRLKSTLVGAGPTGAETTTELTLSRERWGSLLKGVASARRKEIAATPPSTPLQDVLPGVLILRTPARDPKNPNAPQQLLVLFLVGESPTMGVHQKSLFATLNIIASYYSTAGRTAQTEFKIIGPIYTGSDRSLAHVISTWVSRRGPALRPPPYHKWSFIVRTGNAIRVDRDKFITDARAGRDDVVVQFDSTVIHLERVLFELFRFLRRLNGGQGLGKIALLSESDTEFGEVFAGGTVRALLGSPAQVTQMKFPLHVSQVAVAYEEDARKGDRNAPTLVRPSSKLTIPFDETGSPRDIIPALSPAMTAATDEFVMSKILETISSEGFKYVGIIASDTRDMIFVAGLVRQYCPDVQLFSPIGDLLLGHPRYTAELRGMIVASSYPLFSMSQRWDPPYEGDRRRHLFSHQGDQGTYNAIVSMIAADKFTEASYDYGTPFDELSYLHLIWRSDPTLKQAKWQPKASWHLELDQTKECPPVWFTVVGDRGLWPLGYKTVEAGGGAPHLADSSYLATVPNSKTITAQRFVEQFLPLIPQFTWQWGSVFLGLSALCLVVFWVHAQEFYVHTNCTESGSPAAHLRRYSAESTEGPSFIKLLGLWRSNSDPSYSLAIAREVYVVVGILILLFTYYFFAIQFFGMLLRASPWPLFWSSTLRRYLKAEDLWNWVFAGVVLGTGAVSFVCLWLALLIRILRGIRIQHAHLHRNDSNGWQRKFLRFQRTVVAVSIGVAGVGLVATAVVCLGPGSFERNWVPPADLESFLYFERAVNLSNGVSPLVPVLLLALGAGAWLHCQLQRIYLAERFWQKDDDRISVGKGPGEKLLVLVMRRRDRVEWLTKSIIPTHIHASPVGLAASTILVIALLRLSARTIPTADFREYTVALSVSIWFLAMTVVVSLFRFMLLWKATQNLLRVYTSLPMLDAYGRIPEAFSRAFGRYLAESGMKRLHLSIPVQQWITVAREFDHIKRHLCYAMFGNSEDQLDGIKRSAFARIERSIKGLGESESMCTSASAAKAIQAAYFNDTSAAKARDSDNVADSKTWRTLGRAAIDCLHSLVPLWRSPPHDDALKRWMHAAEELLALRVVTFVSQGTLHLRNLAGYLAILPVLLLLVVSSYPIQPQRFLLVFIWSILILVALCGVGVLIQMERNEFMSRVSRTRPDKVQLDRTFFSHILTFLFPLLIAVLAQFPSVSDVIYQWMEPITRVLR
jgi:hypothetical protein